jgi:hypothetical protein
LPIFAAGIPLAVYQLKYLDSLLSPAIQGHIYSTKITEHGNNPAVITSF